MRMIGCRRKNTMTGQRFLQLLSKIPRDEMLLLCMDMLEASAQVVVKTGRIAGPVAVAIDEPGWRVIHLRSPRT